MGGNRNDNVTISNLVVNQNHKWLQRISELNATIHKVTRKLIKLTLSFKNKPYFEKKKKKEKFPEKVMIMQKLAKERNIAFPYRQCAFTTVKNQTIHPTGSPPQFIDAKSFAWFLLHY